MFLFGTSRVIVKLIIGIFLCFNISAFANQCNNDSSIADVVEKLSPAIVNISTTQLVENGNKNLPFSEMPEEFFKFFEEFNKNSGSNKPSKIVSLGSGFLIDDKEKVWLIDFDQGEQRDPQQTWQQANLNRLLRSFNKENAKLPVFHWQADNWQFLLEGYLAPNS